MKLYKVYSIQDGTKTYLVSFEDKLKAMRCAIDWSNENDNPSFVYGRNSTRALYYTHRMPNGTFTILK